MNKQTSNHKNKNTKNNPPYCPHNILQGKVLQNELGTTFHLILCKSLTYSLKEAIPHF